jgi:asparagine synthetase B (glutamine-hydrolysing)
MANPIGSPRVTFNGEIFNSAELKAETDAHDVYQEASAALPDHF